MILREQNKKDLAKVRHEIFVESLAQREHVIARSNLEESLSGTQLKNTKTHRWISPSCCIINKPPFLYNLCRVQTQF